MTKPAITSRITKGTALTYDELDTNFKNLQDSTVNVEVQDSLGNKSVITLNLNDTLKFKPGSGFELQGDPTTKSVQFGATNANVAFAWVSNGTTNYQASYSDPTLYLIPGNGIGININQATKRVTISNTGANYSAGTGIDITNNTVSLQDTAVTPGTYSYANITVDQQGRIIYAGNGAPYSLPTASTTTLGGVKIDGTSITINGSGVISASGSSYTLPTASTTTLGGVKVDGTSITINGSGVISSSSAIITSKNPANGNSVGTVLSYDSVQYKVSASFFPQIAGFNQGATVTGWVTQHVNGIAIRHDQIASTNLSNGVFVNMGTQSIGTNGDYFECMVSIASGSPTTYYLHKVTFYRINSTSFSMVLQKMY